MKSEQTVVFRKPWLDSVRIAKVSLLSSKENFVFGLRYAVSFSKYIISVSLLSKFAQLE